MKSILRKKQQVKKHAGFTLIELIIVIVILGILAVTAAPRFIDISRDAKIAKLEQTKASIKTAADLVFYKANIEGVASEDKTLAMEVFGEPVELEYGYPEARADNGGTDILDLLELSDEFEFDTSNNTYARVGYDVANNGCYVQYNEPNSAGAPSEFEYSVSIVIDGC